MPAPSRRDARLVFAVALAARLAVVAWAAGRIPPTADGTFYQRIAERLSQGLGYTWLWPDGAVTYAAHYPVGYPALVAAVYAVTGPRPVAAMILNAVLGALGAFAAHYLATLGARAAGADARARRLALVAGLLVALHPGLVAYTPALMTEGPTAALITCAAAVTAWARERGSGYGRVILVGLVVGVATLVRPQSLILAPAFGLLASLAPRWLSLPHSVPHASASGGHPTAPTLGARPELRSLSVAVREREGGLSRPLFENAALGWFPRRAIATAAAATLAALLVCAPWTARNCVHMKQCALVSVNGGWNLLIGADAESTGAWSPIKVPEACREVFDEAQKDACFGREARRYIREHPAAWLSLVPSKLAATFDYAGAAPWYLHAANPEAFPWPAKKTLGVIETVYERILLFFALAWAARRAPDEAPGPRPFRWDRLVVALGGGAFGFARHGWVAYASLVVASLLRGRSLWRGPVLMSSTIVVLAATLATHAVFFGSGRYSLVVFPLLAALAPFALARGPAPAPAPPDP
jgi:hypothetical protein